MVKVFDTPINTSDQSIDRVLAAGLPVAFVFLDGKAPAQLEQAMNSLAREYAGQLLVAQIQIKDNPETVRRYQVRQVPAVVTIRNGQVISKAEGIVPTELQQHLLYLLGKGPMPQPKAQPTAGQTTQTRPAPTAGSAQPASPFTVTDATFDQDVFRSPVPVLVDFWAPWCGPCRMMEPIVERLAQSMAGRMRVAKMNVDENPAVSQRYDIQGIPTMMLVKNGQIVDRWAGAMPETAIRNRIARHIT